MRHEISKAAADREIKQWMDVLSRAEDRREKARSDQEFIDNNEIARWASSKIDSIRAEINKW
jgi:hypothetical protein